MPVNTLTTIASSAPNISVTSNATANTLSSSFATLGTTAERWDAILLYIRTNATANRDFLLQLYSNDSGSDTVLGDPIPVRLQSAAKGFAFFARVRIPTGTIIKAKCMDSTGSGVLLVALQGVPSSSNIRQGSATGADAWKFIGTPATTASSAFTVCDGGAVANTFTSTTLGSTTMDANSIGFITRVIVSANSDGQVRILDDGTTIIGNTYTRMINGDNFVTPYGPYEMDATIASGSSLAAGVSCSGTTGGSREVGVVAYIQNLPALSGGSSSTIIQGSGMQRILKDGETTAGRKRVFFDIRDTAGAGWTGSVTGVKAKLSTNGGTAADSTNDIVRVTTPLHYVELSDVEAAAASAGDVIAAWVPAGSGYLASTIGYLEITSENPSTQTVTDIANAVVEAEITAIKTYNRSADTTATIDGPTSGTNSLGVTTDASYNPIKTL